ncbi:hypothetical protein D3C83_97030 [compost metagenome]
MVPHESGSHSDERAHHLAVQIYVELVARNTEISQDAVKLAASATNIATLSLKLSEAFLKAEAEAIAARAPVTKFSLESEDVAKW